jgi:hypothetical protein
MPSNVEWYRGYQIAWNVTELAAGNRWRADAAVVLPAGASGINLVRPITKSEMFNSREKARLLVIKAARDWIDEKLTNAGP